MTFYVADCINCGLTLVRLLPAGEFVHPSAANVLPPPKYQDNSTGAQLPVRDWSPGLL